MYLKNKLRVAAQFSWLEHGADGTKDAASIPAWATENCALLNLKKKKKKKENQPLLK